MLQKMNLWLNQATVRFAKKRGYAAAEKKARYGDFRASRGSANYELRGGLETIRAKCRWLARNSPSMKRFLYLLTVNVVGEQGFMFKSRVRRADGEPDDSLNARVETDWAFWSLSPTVEGRGTLVEMCETSLKTLARDGEVFWEIVTNAAFRDGVAINVFEGDYLDVGLNSIHPTTKNEIKMGVEFDKLGRRVAYHLLTSHPGDSAWFSNDRRQRYRRVPAENIIHVFVQERPGQIRGEPWAVSFINTLKMLDGYRESETMSRRVRSAIMGFFKRVNGSIQTNTIDELKDRVEESDDVNEMDIEPGKMKQLPDGIEFDKFDPGGSQTDYAQFEQQLKKDVAMGAMISVVSHGMETQQISYSSHRGVITEDRDYYKIVQRFFINSTLRIIFPVWLKFRLLQDDVTIPASRYRNIILFATFRGRGWDWVDPGKEVKANTEALATKQTSLTRIAASRGMDIDDLLDEIEEERRKAAKRGLTLEYNVGKRPTSNTSGEDGDDDEEE